MTQFLSVANWLPCVGKSVVSGEGQWQNSRVFVGKLVNGTLENFQEEETDRTGQIKRDSYVFQR